MPPCKLKVLLKAACAPSLQPIGALAPACNCKFLCARIEQPQDLCIALPTAARYNQVPTSIRRGRQGNRNWIRWPKRHDCGKHQGQKEGDFDLRKSRRGRCAHSVRFRLDDMRLKKITAASKVAEIKIPQIG